MSEQDPSGRRRRLRGLMIDVSALRESASFRRMFAAQLLSSIGSQVTLLALFVQVWRITHSELAVGALGLVMVGPTMVVALLGGAIADSMDRRRLLVMVQLVMAVTSGLLAWLAMAGQPPVWALYALAAATSAFAAIDGPTRTAVVPMLVEERTLRSAVQLREVLTQSGRTFGPIIGGLLIARVDLAAAYAVDAATFVIAFVMFLGLPPLLPRSRRRFELSAIVEALQHVGARPVLASTFIADLVAMIFGQQRALYPAYAALVFGGGDQTTGLLMAAPSAGAMLGLLVMGLFRNVRREGLAVLVSVSVWGACIALFSQAPWLWLALVWLAIAGAADMVSAVFRQTIFLDTVPDELRGRLGAVHIMVVTGGPPLGDGLSGAGGEFIGARRTSLVGGLAVIAGMIALGTRVPTFARWRRATEASPAVDNVT